MGSNSFGRKFVVTTFGESHGAGIGCVIDGCPAGLAINEEMINKDMRKRRPGHSPYTSSRKESDEVKILSGIFEGKSTGTPIMLWIENEDSRPRDYSEVKNLYRIGHGNFTYLKKYGIFDYRGGGRASARETAVRVAAAAIAKALLGEMKISSKIVEVGGAKENFQEVIKEVMLDGDSVGGVIECVIQNPPIGLGEPIYNKVQSALAAGMLSINACKGVEFGEGFNAARMRGSEHNDEMKDGGFSSNHHGGILAGITTGEDIVFRVAFKPTSTIKKPMRTITSEGENVLVHQKTNTRHDPCIVLRAPIVVEAMAALTMADFILLNKGVRLEKSNEEEDELTVHYV